jgi:hypothetical protein
VTSLYVSHRLRRREREGGFASWPSWLRARLVETFGLDLRSLALFRVAIASCALADLAIRSSDLVAHYTDAGIAPRHDLLEEFAFLHDRALCFHLIGGSAASQAILFAIAALAAVALLVGLRTRAAAVVLWALTSSLQLRNLYVGAGYDALLRMLLLWSCFLPLGARVSVDAAREGRADVSRPHVSVGSVALIVQLALVFFLAGYGKWLQPAWRDGSALARIFADDMRVTAFGAALREHAELMSALTWVVPWFEMLAPLLFLSPIWRGPVRTLTVAGLAAMAVGFGVTLHVGLFPFVTAAGVSALLPSWFWDVAWQRLRRLVRRPASPEPRAESPRRGIIGQSVCAVLLAFVVFWNVGPLLSANTRMPAALDGIGRTLFLQQAWTMFAEPATRTGWVVMPGKLKSSRAIDLLAAGGRVPNLDTASRPVPWGMPPSYSAGQYANDRWRNFLDRAVRGTDTQRRLNLYGRFLCRSWNGAHEGEEQLAIFELWWIAAEIDSSARLGPYERKLLWSHDCFS